MSTGNKKRVIALDTETTGLSWQDGDRVIEIGGVELIGNMETGNNFHTYINPYPRRVHPDAFAVHGITDEVLADAPRFREVYRDFLDFIGDSALVIHNAPFDMGFLNEEFARLSLPPIQNEVIDTLRIARAKEPTRRASLDHLCQRYGVDNTDRTLHGALIDAALLARVYVKMMDLDKLDFDVNHEVSESFAVSDNNYKRIFRPSRGVLSPSEDELSAHREFISGINEPVWGFYSKNS